MSTRRSRDLDLGMLYRLKAEWLQQFRLKGGTTCLGLLGVADGDAYGKRVTILLIL